MAIGKITSAKQRVWPHIRKLIESMLGSLPNKILTLVVFITATLTVLYGFNGTLDIQQRLFPEPQRIVQHPVSASVEREAADERSGPFLGADSTKYPPAKQNLQTVSASVAREAANEKSGPFLGTGSIPEFFSKLNMHEAGHLVHRSVIDENFNCSDIVRIGNLIKNGGYQVCIQEPYKPKLNDCLVYSFGINNEWSFDEGMNNMFGCEVHSFDPSMKKEDHMHKDNIYFHNLGLWGSNFKNDRGWEMKDLKTIVTELKHTNRIIDYLKIDVEGAEWPLIEHIVQSGIHSQVKQMMIEIHTPRLKKDVMTLTDYGEVFNGLEELKNVGFQKFLCSMQYNCCCSFAVITVKDIGGHHDLCCYEIFYVNSKLSK